MIQGLIHPLVFWQKFNSKYYSKHDFPEKFNSKNIQNLVFQKYSIQKLFKTFFSEIFNSKSYSFSDLWRNSIQKYYSKLDFFLDSIQKKYSKLDFSLDSIQKNIHSIPKKEYLPWLGPPEGIKPYFFSWFESLETRSKSKWYLTTRCEEGPSKANKPYLLW